jgi:hypothetical protein
LQQHLSPLQVARNKREDPRKTRKMVLRRITKMKKVPTLRVTRKILDQLMTRQKKKENHVKEDQSQNQQKKKMLVLNTESKEQPMLPQMKMEVNMHLRRKRKEEDKNQKKSKKLLIKMMRMLQQSNQNTELRAPQLKSQQRKKVNKAVLKSKRRNKRILFTKIQWNLKKKSNSRANGKNINMASGEKDQEKHL